MTGAGIGFALASGALAGRTMAAALERGAADRVALAAYGATIRRRAAPHFRAELLAQHWLGDPNRLAPTLRAGRNVPGSSALGAWLLLHLG
jgi:flavin-dependent dehydrogenase